MPSRWRYSRSEGGGWSDGHGADCSYGHDDGCGHGYGYGYGGRSGSGCGVGSDHMQPYVPKRGEVPAYISLPLATRRYMQPRGWQR